MKKFLSILLLFLIIFLVNTSTQVFAAPPVNFQTEQIITDGLDGPSGFEIAPDGRIFILQRTGEIKIYKNGQLLPDNFAVLPSIASGDRGLIGIAFDPEFGINNHYIYFYYTGLDKLNRLVRFDATTDIGQNGPYLIYQTNSLSEELHVGGSIRFGPDGKMYFAVGDNGYPPNAQNLSNPHGKILRINKDGSIPLDNPFVGQSGVLPEIWAYGFRNPWRFQFDSVTGKLYGGDVGDYTWEEVNHIQKGKNYGWPVFEGYCNTLCGTTITPIYTYNHDGESAAVTGGPIYRGTMFPEEYQGNLFFGDYAKGFIKRLTLDENSNSTGLYDFDTNAGSVVDMKVAPDGSFYYITYWPGRLYRISYTLGNHVPTANATVDDPDGVEPHTVHFSSAGSFDPDGDPITYFWEFGDGTTSTEANPTKTYYTKGAYAVELAVSDGTNTSQAVPVVVQVGIPPTVNIGEPADGSNYRAGDTIHYTASALDGAGFDINDNNLSTVILLHHGTHIHPFLGPIIGRQGTFTIPTTGEASADTWFEIKVTATDENGLSTNKSTFIYPITSTFTLETNPPGLKINLDGVPQTPPVAVEGVVGFERELNAPAVQTFNGKQYGFNHWSDNLSQKHFITIEETNQTYTAHFEELPAFTGEYYNNTELAGTPALTRQDNAIDFDWLEGSPDPLININNFSVKWTRSQYFAAGKYKFTTSSDDGLRLYIDDQLLIDQWHDGVASYNATTTLASGQHTIRLEYLEVGGGANIKLLWDLTPDQPAIPTEYSAQYFNNKTLSGSPMLIRNDTEIDFDWAGGSPDASITNDNFSARWLKTVDLVTGNYEFTITGDDGIRLFIDNELILDKWIDQPSTTYKITKALLTGNHTIKIEYYENGGEALAKFSYIKLPDAPINGFNAEYYNNSTLSGAPLLTRNDTAVNFDWASGSPDPLIPNDNFSARWTKTENFAAGTYEFTVTADDGVRLKIDNEIILDKWIDQPSTTYKISKTLTEGNHAIVMEYFETGGGAVAKLNYEQTTTPPTPTDGFLGEYFNNQNLTAPIALTRQDAIIDFDWAGGSPDASITNDNFSARWLKTVDLVTGNYEFTITGDDGIRLFIDNELILDKWIDQPSTTYTVQKALNAGNHTLVIEYYENGGGALAKFNYNQITPTPDTNFNAKFWNTPGTGEFPPIPTTAPDLTRTDAEINYQWDAGSPDSIINGDHFLAIWTKNHFFDGGIYKFITESDDGMRVYIDDQLVLDEWNDHSMPYTFHTTVTPGIHALKIEYYENDGGAKAKFRFEPTDTIPPFYHAEYFNNETLTGAPVLTREEEILYYVWAEGTPDPLVNPNHFSARWTKTDTFTPGTYKFTVFADDAMRLYIDGNLEIDAWLGQSEIIHEKLINLTGDSHTLVVEYAELTGGAYAKMYYEKVADTPNPNPSPSPLPTPAPGEFLGEYFNNTTLTAPAALTRNDAIIDFDWAGASPDANITNDNFSARWTKTHTFEDGTYKFTTISDDGIRVYIDNEIVIDQWNDHPATTHTGQKILTAGEHTIKIEYFENGGGALAKFNFEKITTPPVADGAFIAEYFNTMDLSGPLAIIREEANINFNWGMGSPDPAVNADAFSARFTKQKQLTAGSYTFTTKSDDGVRLYIDNQLIIDNWTNHPMTVNTATITLAEGMHNIELEYYENDGSALIILEE